MRTLSSSFSRRAFLGLAARAALAGAVCGPVLSSPSALLAAQGSGAAGRSSGRTGASVATDLPGGPRLVCPARAEAGQPFLVRVEGLDPASRVSFSWGGTRGVLEVEEAPGSGSLGPRPRIPAASGPRSGLPALVQALFGWDLAEMPAGGKPLVRDLAVTVEEGGRVRSLTRSVTLVPRKYPQERLTLPQGMVTPPDAAVEARIRREREAVARAVAPVTSARRWTLPLERPVPGVVLSAYGLRRVLNGTPKSPHRGLDFRGAQGTPVAACADGVAVLCAEHYYSGNSVYLDHGGGVYSMYFHLSEISVTEGETVGRGVRIGAVGATGRSTGPHLHFSLRVPGGLVDPAPLLG